MIKLTDIGDSFYMNSDKKKGMMAKSKCLAWILKKMVELFTDEQSTGEGTGLFGRVGRECLRF